MSASMLEIHAQEKVGIEGWRVWVWEALGLTLTQKTQCFRMKGAVAPNFKKGKRAGEINWRAKDQATVREVYITPAEHEAWCIEWEHKTGKCHVCRGEGKTASSWSATEGLKHRQCSRCIGTGIAAHLRISEAA